MARVLADAIPKLLVDSELTTLPSITISFVLYIALDTALAVIFEFSFISIFPPEVPIALYPDTVQLEFTVLVAMMMSFSPNRAPYEPFAVTVEFSI